MKTMSAALAAAALLAVAGCGGSDVPPYKVTQDKARGAVHYITVQVKTDDGLREVFRDVMDGADDGGYNVAIDCATGGTGTSANRLANGRFAVGAQGEAATGLSDGQSEYAAVAGASCP